MDKLDVAPQGTANGPEGGPDLDWHSINWAREERTVRRLRQRIFKASQEGDLAKVRNLQKLMLRSRSNTLVSVRRVTQRSTGRKTAGVDGVVVLTPKGRAKLAMEVQESPTRRPKPVKRVYIPKSNGKQRPLGIPVIRDRVMQARVKNALEPEWEARFEPRSYGFRPGRSCHDAVESIFSMTCRKSQVREWVLDADLSAAFDRIHHDHLMQSIGSFPEREAIRGWLKAGVMENGRWAPTEEGTPQGGVISPLLLNIALNGMEEAVGVKSRTRTGMEPGAKPGTPVLVRYADDFVVLTYSKEEAERAKRELALWLEPRGLRFNEEKTQIVHLDEGFDFLGFNIRRSSERKIVIRPSNDAVRRIRERLRTEVKALYGANTAAVLRKLTPIVRGWATYYRGVMSSQIFGSLDTYVWKLTYKWTRRSHPNKPTDWTVKRYYGSFNKSRADKWVFGDRRSGAHLYKFAWTPIVRHVRVKGAASMDDPALQDYWTTRRKKKAPPVMDKSSLSLAFRQQGLCPLCNGALIDGAEYEPDNPRKWIEWFAAVTKVLHKHHFVYRRDGGGDERKNLQLIHADCHRQHHEADDKKTGRKNKRP
ncbi:group II intron reverse transcriptase/maturase [Streptosporangium sp. NPDC006007]|uniref:group II intron reverse transcriptase/maturase n=1 Tax=Streptosporangium sp. NPDC006007 TaxID=3154575 RepID=UPI0033A3AD7D